MNVSGKCDRNLEAETHLCEGRCLVRFQGKNGTCGGKSRVRSIQNYSDKETRLELSQVLG